MAGSTQEGFRFSDADLDFVVGAAAPEAADKERLKRLVREDERFRESLVGDERVYQKLAGDDEVFVKISPPLYFEVLLRRALNDMRVATHTVERAGRQSIPVFDTPDVVEFLGRPGVVDYLAHMLASFTRIQSHVGLVRMRGGVRRRLRYNDMDIDSLVRLCATADENHRLSLYKRIADVCLFVSGIFPDYTLFDPRRPGTDRPASRSVGRLRRSLEDYESEGRRFYGL